MSRTFVGVIKFTSRKRVITCVSVGTKSAQIVKNVSVLCVCVKLQSNTMLLRSTFVSVYNSEADGRLCVFVALQVEEVKKHSHCLAFSSAGPQSQTYYVSFDSFTEHLRWHRHAAKVNAAWTRTKTNSSICLVFLVFPFPSNSNLLHQVYNTDQTHIERWQLLCIRAFSLHVSCVLTEVITEHINLSGLVSADTDMGRLYVPYKTISHFCRKYFFF